MKKKKNLNVKHPDTYRIVCSKGHSDTPEHIGKKRKLESSYKCTSVSELRQILRSRGLREDGNADELTTRLISPTPSKRFKVSNVSCPKTSPKDRPHLTIDAVNEKFHQLGYIPQKVSSCVKSAIMKGYIRLESRGSLDQIICQGTFCCGKNVQVKLRDILYQKDQAGDHYEGGGGATVKCKVCSCGIYVTRICENTPEFDSGKNHNHCVVCGDFGTCIGDHRLSHCKNCGKHYFQGESDLECVCVTNPDNLVRGECGIQ